MVKLMMRSRERSISPSNGFALLEVMVAVGILAIALVAILKANLQSLDALLETGETTTVSLLASSKLAEVVAVGPAEWNESHGDFGKDYPGASWQVDISPTELEGITRVVVTVDSGRGGRSGRVKMEELLYSD